VRGDLERQDLTAARSGLERIQTADREDPVVRRLRDDLIREEARRDTALEAARDCLQNNGWECAIGHARSALAVDRSSDEARRIVERVRDLGLSPDAKTTDRPTPNLPTAPTPVAKGTIATRDPKAGDESTLNDCDILVAAGRRALTARKFDEAIARANDPLAALGLCPGAEQLKRDAIRAKSEALR
jgi:hypothetical protein